MSVALMSGMFVVLEGPNGVGKSTVLAATVKRLASRTGEAVHATKEPSATVFGSAIRELEQTMPPIALALACAADRHDHVTREIEPLLSGGGYVLSDRYVPSSLVLQRLDGLDLEYVWALNDAVRKPDLTVYLDDDASTISRRVSAREKHSRLELGGSSARELDLYEEARLFLDGKGWNQHVVDCRGLESDAVATAVVASILVDRSGTT